MFGQKPDGCSTACQQRVKQPARMSLAASLGILTAADPWLPDPVPEVGQAVGSDHGPQSPSPGSAGVGSGLIGQARATLEAMGQDDRPQTTPERAGMTTCVAG